TVAAAERLANALDVRATIIPRWGEIHLEAVDGDARFVSVTRANPVGVDMDRVVAAMASADELAAGRLEPSAFRAALDAIATRPPAPTWLFALAAGAAAAALAV